MAHSAIRHTYARRFLEEHGGTLDLLQKYLGHSKIGITQDHYGHFSDSTADKIAQALIYGDSPGLPTSDTRTDIEAGVIPFRKVS